MLCTACGSVEKAGHLPDGGAVADASPDAPVPGTVHVTVLDPAGTGAPAVGANVVFINPDGTLVKKATTDTAGKASADVLPGANVTSVVLNGTLYQLQTALSIKPGDDIILGSKNTDTTVAGNFTVSFPAYVDPVTGGAAPHYLVGASCGYIATPQAAGVAATTATLTINNNCKQDAMEIVVMPADANFAPLMTLNKTGVMFMAGGSTTLVGPYLSMRSVTASYSNINAAVTNLSMARTVPDGYGISSNSSIQTPGTAEVLTTAGAQGSSAQVATTAANAKASVQQIRQTIGGSAATYGLDVTATLLPWIGTPSYDAANTKLLIPTDMAGTTNDAPDLFQVRVRYSRTDGNNTTQYAWTLFGPTIADIVLPSLPAELAAILPTASDTVSFPTPGAVALEADSIADYDAVRHDLNATYNLYISGRYPASTVRLSRSPALRQ